MSKRIRWCLEDLKKSVEKSKTMSEVLQRLGLRTAGGNYNTVKKYIRQLNISTDHFSPEKVRLDNLRRVSSARKKTFKQSFKNPREVSLATVRKRFREYCSEEVCSTCGQQNVWNGKKLVLQVDHIDGDTTNCEVSNLRYLCPNCHTQTPNYAGKVVKKDLCSCSNLKLKNSKLCRVCSNRKYRKNNTKIDWPETSYLIKRSKEIGFSALGRELGVSDNAIRKRIKTRGH